MSSTAPDTIPAPVVGPPSLLLAVRRRLAELRLVDRGWRADVPPPSCDADTVVTLSNVAAFVRVDATKFLQVASRFRPSNAWSDLWGAIKAEAAVA